MATLYVSEDDVDSKLPWLYTLLTKIPVEIVKIDASDREQTNLVNPLKATPYLVSNDVHVWGTVAVILFIAERYSSNAMHGKTVDESAKVNSALLWCSGTLSRSILINYVYPQTKAIYKLPVKDNVLMVELGFQNTMQQLNTMEENYFQGCTFMCGNEETIVDYYAAIILMELDKVDFDFSKWHKTENWLIKMREKINGIFS